jgi:nicotinate-nucleotide pyrophosphorylase (carboxylating)
MTEHEPERRRAPRIITPLANSGAAGGHDPLRFPLIQAQIVAFVRSALEEDRAFGDVTTVATVRSDRRARATLVARATGILAGVPLALEAFRILDSLVNIRVDVEDGGRVTRGAPILYLSGHSRALLSGERVALNFLQRLSGIASLTRRYVDAVADTDAHIFDTRKTTPGWRRLEKYAVRAGGGLNHRMDLGDRMLIKDNHLAVLNNDIATAVRWARERVEPGASVEVECDRPEQVDIAVNAGADVIMLDNMPLEMMRDCVRRVGGSAILEASGGVTLETVRAIAETGVDRIAVGALTHSAPALDLALDFNPL